MSFMDLFALMPAYAVFVAVMVFVFGCCMGSFINCLAWRVVNGESVVKGRSHCAVCGHALSALDLVPVLSWLCLRGKCRYCGQPIAVRYTVSELMCGVCFLSVLLVFGIDVQVPFLMALGCVLLGLSLIDLDSMIIPNKFVLAGVLLWVAMVACQYAAGVAGLSQISAGVDFGVVAGVASGLVENGGNALVPVVDGLLSAVVIAGLVLVVSCVFKALTGKAGMGMGDIKLYFMVSLYLGLAAGVLNLFLSCIVGLVFAMVSTGRSGAADAADGMSVKTMPADSNGLPEVCATESAREGESASGGKNAQSTGAKAVSKAFPFGPSIAIATWFTLLFGQPLVAAYFSLF